MIFRSDLRWSSSDLPVIGRQMELIPQCKSESGAALEASVGADLRATSALGHVWLSLNLFAINRLSRDKPERRVAFEAERQSPHAPCMKQRFSDAVWRKLSCFYYCDMTCSLEEDNAERLMVSHVAQIQISNTGCRRTVPPDTVLYSVLNCSISHIVTQNMFPANSLQLKDTLFI